MTKPKISIVMTVYNGEKYIKSAIESILNETMKDFELMVVNDGSTDNTETIIKSFDDQRIHFLNNDGNKGSIYSRNRAIKESVAPYIAILDSDDIALPKRLERQAEFLECHPGFAVIGTGVELIDENSKLKGVVWKNKLPPEMIPGILLFQNYFANSSTMFRRVALPDIVYRDMNPADDYDLWLRLDKKWKMWNLPEVLVQYRVHGNNMSTVDSERGREKVKQMVTEALKKNLQINATDDEYDIHRYNYTYDGNNYLLFFEKRENWLKKLKAQNEKVLYYDSLTFSKVLAERWLTTCSSNTRFGMWTWKKFWKSSLVENLNIVENFTKLSKFFIKCLFRKDILSLKLS